MATPINYALLRYQADNIPNFDGNTKILPRFLKASENLLRAFQDIANPEAPINICLLDTIFSKLRGRAADLICPRHELNTWELVKNVLVITFSDLRGMDCLEQELATLKPLQNETLLNFGNRIQDTRSLLFTKLNETIDDAQIKLIKLQMINETACKTFINHLPYHIQLAVRLKTPDSLEQAMSYTIEEQNFIEYRNQSQNKNNMMYKPKPLPQNVTPNRQYHPVNHQNQNNTYRQSHPVNYQNQNYPNKQGHPINYQNYSYRQNAQSSFPNQNATMPMNRPSTSFNPTNRQSNSFQYPNTYNPNFRNNTPPTNVFQSNPQNARFLPKPVPMDTSSGQTKFTKPSFSTRLHNQYVNEPSELTTQNQTFEQDDTPNDYYQYSEYPDNSHQYPDTTSYDYNDDTVPCKCHHEQSNNNSEPTDFSHVNFPITPTMDPET